MTKWPVQKLAQGTTQKFLQHHDTTDIKKHIFLCFQVKTLDCLKGFKSALP